MQDRGYGLPRTPLLGTPVNKGILRLILAFRWREDIVTVAAIVVALVG